MAEPDGRVVRIKLARTPNWEITNPDDIKSQWWAWKNPRKPFDNYMDIGGQRRHLAFDKEHINESKPEAYYKDAILWTTKGWVMGSPFPTRVLHVDREQGALAEQSQLQVPTPAEFLAPQDGRCDQSADRELEEQYRPDIGWWSRGAFPAQHPGAEPQQ